MMEQKVYLLLENLDQLWNINIDLAILLILLVDVCSKELFFENLILIAVIVLH